MSLSRRGLLVAGAAGMAGAVGGRTLFGGEPASADLDLPLTFHSPKVQPFVDQMPVLPTIRSGKTVAVTARTTSHRFHRDYDLSPALAYRSGDHLPTYLGPIVEVQRDESVAVSLRNAMGIHPFAADVDTSLHGATESFGSNPRTTLHLHGGVVPPAADGHPQDFIERGEKLVNRYPNRQDATALWLHDHSLGTTRLNVYAGLAMPYLIRDQWDTGRKDNPLGLPAGEYELPLLIQEKIFTKGGRQSIRSTPIVPKGKWEGGAIGDVGIVNGKAWPELKVARGLYRFRLYNAGSYSIWNLYFSNKMRFWVIGSEGGLLNAPAPVTELRMGPAERYDVLVDFNSLAAGETVTLCNNEPAPLQAAQLLEKPMPFFCRFKATSAKGFRGSVPTRLRGGKKKPPAVAAPTVPPLVRNLTISQRWDLNRLVPPALMTLNNLRFTDPQIELPRQGTYEIWNLINVSTDPHIIHIHLVNFRVLERQKFNSGRYRAKHLQPALGTKWNPSAEPFLTGAPQAIPAYERGWKDTVIVDPASITRVAIRWPTADELGFDPDASFRPQGATAQHVLDHGDDMSGHDMSGDMAGMDMGAQTALQGYMWHCHMLEHEDHDMMLRFRTVKGSSS